MNYYRFEVSFLVDVEAASEIDAHDFILDLPLPDNIPFSYVEDTFDAELLPQLK